MRRVVGTWCRLWASPWRGRMGLSAERRATRRQLARSEEVGTPFLGIAIAVLGSLQRGAPPPGYAPTQSTHRRRALAAADHEARLALPPHLRLRLRRRGALEGRPHEPRRGHRLRPRFGVRATWQPCGRRGADDGEDCARRPRTHGHDGVQQALTQLNFTGVPGMPDLLDAVGDEIDALYGTRSIGPKASSADGPARLRGAG